MFPFKLTLFLITFIYYQLTDINGQYLCPGQDSNFCQRKYSKGNTPQSPSAMNESEFKNHRCFCDEECWRFGDCCSDAVQPNRQWIRYGVFIKKYCHQITKFSPRVYVIKTCSSNWKDDNTRLLCDRKIEPENYHPVLDIPFISNYSKRAYLNIYCAKCNYDIANGFILKLNLSCVAPNDCIKDFKEIINWYQPGKLQWILPNHVVVQARLNNPEFSNFRRCRQVDVDSCPNNWTNADIAKLCLNHSLHILNNRTGVMYKNIHCAQCNSENLTTGNLICPAADPPTLSYHKSSVFSLLMDFSLEPEGSANNEIYIKFREDRIPPICGEHYKLVKERCIFRNSTHNISTLSCTPTPVPIAEFFVFPNGSLYRNTTRNLYSMYEMELLNNNTYNVCIDDDEWMLQSAGLRQFSAIQSWLSTVCMSISLLCLAAHITIHCVTGKYRNLPGKTLLNLSVALFFGQLLFLFGVDRTENQNVCFIVAILIHFTFLAAFFWMNVMAVDIYRTFSQSYQRSSWNSRTFFYYCSYAWLIPLIIVIASVTIDLVHPSSNIRPLYGQGVCWISNRYALFIFFALPVAVIIIGNLTLFIITARAIHETVETICTLKTLSERKRFHVYVKLAVVIGLTWILGFAAAATDFAPLWYAFIIFNASQGAFIFIIFSLKRSILEIFYKKLTGKSIVTITSSGSSKRSEFTSLKRMSSAATGDETSRMLTSKRNI